MWVNIIKMGQKERQKLKEKTEHIATSAITGLKAKALDYYMLVWQRIMFSECNVRCPLPRHHSLT
jgi:hypothetical protein